jgi:2',3'-cyclic-nucleotide 2'-phosphodiesterase (5'-nucleotidase family)
MTSPLLRLRILHTNDIHSHFEQMPSIAAAFRELRASNGNEQTLLLDIGDHMDRMRPETEGSSGAANLAVMNETGYEAVTIGNNEGLTFTKEALSDLYGSRQSFKVICSNLIDADTGKLPSWAVPYHIVEKGGIRVGLIGVTAYFPDFYSLLGWNIQEPIEVTAKLVRELRPQVDLIVVLSHIGLKNDEKMASEVSGIDIILGGHTHHLLETPLRFGNTLVCGAGKFGQYYGVVDVQLDALTRKPVSLEGYVSKVNDDPRNRDDQVSAIIERFEASSSEALSQEVAYLQQPLASEWYAEAALGNLLAAGLRKRVGTDISLVNAGQFLDSLAAGPVTIGRLLEICPSPINPCLIILTGGQILQALEESLLPEFQSKPIYGFGFRGKVLGMLNVDGLTVDYDKTAPAYSKVKRVWIEHELLAEEKEYKVASIDMFTFGVGYHSLAKGRGVQYLLPEFLRDIMQTELQDVEAIRQSRSQRWHQIP